MKIDNIKISNILSFRDFANTSEIPVINLNIDMNILVGPNGSGKSNFLEILTRIFRNYLIAGCIYDPQNIVYSKNHRGSYSLRNTIRRESRFYPLSKYRYSDSKQMIIELEISLSQGDIDNLLFIRRNRDDLLSLFSKYTDALPQFEIIDENTIHSLKRTELSFILQENNNTPNVNLKNNDAVNRYVYDYFQYFDYLQHLINLSNIRESKNWDPLMNTFLLLSSHRDYHAVENSFPLNNSEGYRPQDLANRMAQDSALVPIAQEPNAILTAKYILTHKFNHLRESILKGKISLPRGFTDTELFETSEPSIKNINCALNDLLNLHLKIEKQAEDSLTFDFQFFRNDKPIQTQELSSGEKGIIYLLIGLYGLDIRDGLVIIDEPEIHMHPQIQQKLIKIFDEVRNNLNLQIVIATHSPVFITPKTIHKVHRFYKSENSTKIISSDITQAERDLVNILNYTNSAKLFFSSKVVMVEGDSDEYFYRYLFDFCKESIIFANKEVDFLYIRGKGNYNTWKEFLAKFSIESYYIGDLDNILDEKYGIIDKELKKRLRSAFDKSQFSKTDKSDRIFLQYLKNECSLDWKEIVSKIDQIQKQGIFFLQQGLLEDYIYEVNTRGKLDNIIEFCKSHFCQWVIDVNYSTKRVEMLKILKALIN